MSDPLQRLTDPASKADVQQYLDAIDQPAIFEVQYTDDGEERTRLVADLLADFSDLRPSATPLHGPPSVRLTRVTPETTTHDFVPVEDVTAITAVEPREELFPVTGDTPSERAAQLKRYATAVPTVVSVSDLVEVLDNSDDESILPTLDALQAVARVRPSECVGLIPKLRELVESSTGPRRVQALACLGTLAESHPEDIAPSTGVIVEAMLADDDHLRDNALRCLAAIAESQPKTLGPHAESIATVAEEGTDSQASRAVYALNCLAGVDLAAVKPHVGALGSVLQRDEASAVALSNAVAALGRITKEYPGAVGGVVGEVGPLLEAESVQLRANAAGLLADISQTDPAAVFTCTETLLGLLDDEDDFVRANASGSLARVMEADPERLEHAIERFIDLLGDGHPVVRENACWALGYAEADEAREKLDNLSTADSEESVRARASWALDELSDG